MTHNISRKYILAEYHTNYYQSGKIGVNVKKIFFFLILFFVFAPPALATDYYVSVSSGTDSNPGSIALPWRTIQKAADTVLPGDTVYVRGGNYTTGGNGITLTRSGAPNAYISFQNYPGETPVITGGGWSGFTDYYSSSPLSHIQIIGFEFDGTNKPNYNFGINLVRSSNVIISNNTVHDVITHGIYIKNSNTGEISNNVVYDVGGYYGIGADTVSNYTIHQNIAHDNGQSGIAVDRSRDITIHHNKTYDNDYNGIVISHATTNARIYNNISYHNSCGSDQRYEGIGVEVSAEKNLIYNNLAYNNCHANFLTNSSNNYIFNNTFYGNDGVWAGYSVLYGDWEGSIPENNIFKNNIFVITRSSDSAVGSFNWENSYEPRNNVFDYNNYYYTDSADKSNLVRLNDTYSFTQWRSMGKEAHGVLENPNFVDATAADYRLQTGSPLIDKGLDVRTYVTNDYAGIPRPQGEYFDIGAYEYVVNQSQQPSDANGDTHVDEADYQIWLSNFGKTSIGQSFGDFNNSGIVDGVDYVVWVNNYGT